MEWGEYTGIFCSGDRAACNVEVIDGYFGENKPFTELSWVGRIQVREYCENSWNAGKMPGNPAVALRCGGTIPLGDGR